MVNANSTPQRNVGEAILDVLYGIRFNDLNVRFYRRLDGLLASLNLILGSAAAVTLLSKQPEIAGWSGLLVAIVSAIDKTMKPADKALRCAEHRAKFGALAARAHDMNLADIDRELRVLQACGPDTIEALAIPAFNDNLRSNGHYDDIVKVPFLGRLACLIA